MVFGTKLINVWDCIELATVILQYMNAKVEDKLGTKSFTHTVKLADPLTLHLQMISILVSGSDEINVAELLVTFDIERFNLTVELSKKV